MNLHTLATIIDAALICISVALPIAGLLGVRRKADRDAQALKATAAQWDPEHPVMFGEFDILIGALRAMVVKGPSIATQDLLLIGGGIFVGGLAGIWGLWL